MIRVTFTLTALLACSFPARGENSPQNDVGMSDEQPEAGHFVAVGDRYMVPYTAKIPGTDVTYTMTPIPAGRFDMGSPPDETDRKKDEGPQRPVRVEAFWMGTCEVTWGEYRQYMRTYAAFKRFEALGIRRVTEDNKADAITSPTPIYLSEYRYEYGDDARLPAVSMSQYGAQQYTHWLSGITCRFYRLPSEAEWEYACRAGTKSPYSFGDGKLANFARTSENADDKPHFVGTKRPNPWGLFDMHGNVGEWVLDAYSKEGYTKLDMGRDAAEVIRWPTKRMGHVVRGGSWAQPAAECRSAARRFSTEEWWNEDVDLPQSPWWLAGGSDDTLTVGFRILRPLRPPERAKQNRYWDAGVEDLRTDVDDRLKEGRAARGLVDPDLPAAMRRVLTEKP